ncbi:hypothetical protein Y032_0042g584 [Ancylostoma ceylanicum]|uniref:Uncharacterized protein n=1 Tax=Ancylostoma ceylanicum TaxID=53326 RepID=A0A016UFE0_9BILA|nr:hypothetical protein Y032_0042g584 [Ancylostoma ceylanicum]
MGSFLLRLLLALAVFAALASSKKGHRRQNAVDWSNQFPKSSTPPSDDGMYGSSSFKSSTYSKSNARANIFKSIGQGGSSMQHRSDSPAPGPSHKNGKSKKTMMGRIKDKFRKVEEYFTLKPPQHPLLKKYNYI